MLKKSKSVPLASHASVLNAIILLNGYAFNKAELQQLLFHNVCAISNFGQADLS